MARLRLFAGARAAAGTGRDEVPGLTVAQVLEGAVHRYGPEFQQVLSVSRVWVNGEPAADEDAVADGDEVAVLPPVSGGATTMTPDGESAWPPDPDVGESAWDSDPAPAIPVSDGSVALVAEPHTAPPIVAARRVAVPARARVGARPHALRPAPPAVPHGRLGVIWGALTAGAVLGGHWTFAAWLSLGAVVAVLALARSRDLKPVAVPGTVLAALAAPLVAVMSGWAGLGILVLGLGADVLVRHRRRASKGVGKDANLVSAAGTAAGLAAVCLVLLDRRSLTLLGVLLALVCLHDASRYLVGWGAPSRWEGKVAGIAAVGSATLALAVLDPSPLSGAYPWVVGALVAGAGAFGPALVGRVEGDQAVGPLRRLDTLLLAAPAVVLTAAVAHLG